MEKAKRKLSIASAALLSVAFIAPSVLAAGEHPFGIDYSGGDILGARNVREFPEDYKLDPIMKVYSDTDGNAPSYSLTVNGANKSLVKDGYVSTKDGENHRCYPVKYVTMSTGEHAGDFAKGNDIKFNLTQGDNTLEVSLKDIALENIKNKTVDNVETPSTIMVGISTVKPQLYAGYRVFEEQTDIETCATQDESISQIPVYNNSRIFVELDIKMVGENSENVITDALYFGITDIDNDQSYRILNKSNYLTSGTKGNLFTFNLAGLQEAEIKEDTLRNMFVTDNQNGGYIYSENYNVNRNNCAQDEDYCYGILNLLNTSDIYTPISRSTQAEGLDIVLGFATGAYSGIEYYSSSKVEVTYTSDAHGELTGKDDEVVSVDGNPTGSASKANSGYKFAYWIADQDVELKDGTKIKAGQPITPTQVTQIVVHENLILTAIHESDSLEPVVQTAIVTYESDENGKITGITEEELNTYTVISGTTTEPNEGYVFSHWIADKDVNLVDSTKIAAGELISSEQFAMIVLIEDLTLTAIHEEATPAVPDTGMYTGRQSASFVVVSLLSVSAIALLIKMLPLLTHKKLGFDK